MVKVKLSLKSHGDSERGMECWVSILTLTFGTDRTADLSALRADRTLPRTLVISGRDSVDSRATACGQKN